MKRAFSYLQKKEDFWKPKELRKRPELFSIHKPKRVLEFDEEGLIPVYKYKRPKLRTATAFATWALPTSLSWVGLVKNPSPCKPQTESAKNLSAYPSFWCLDALEFGRPGKA